MTKRTMINNYRKYSAADSYIVGFISDKMLYFINLAEIAPRFLNVEQASRNQGENLRLRLKKAHKAQLMKKDPICLGSADMLVSDKYNKGEIFEKLVTEYYGQKWEKDTVPFWVQGDINLKGSEVQIKLDSATLMNTKQIAKLKKVSSVLKKSNNNGWDISLNMFHNLSQVC